MRPRRPFRRDRPERPEGPGRPLPPHEDETRVVRPATEEETRVVRPAGDEDVTRVVRRTRRVDSPPPPPPVERVRRVGPPERNPWPWLLALLLLVLGGIAAAYLLSQRDDEPDTVAVPSVVGSREADAVSRLQRAGLNPRIARQFAERPRGIVLRQQPAGAANVKRGAAVTLYVSRGPGTVAVPNLQGLSEAEAASKLTALGLEANVVRVPSTEPDGTVIAQSPARDERIGRGETVRINVSRGVTRTQTTTTTTATTAATTSTTATTGTTTTPGAGTTTAPPEDAEVPDVVGQSEIDAAAALGAVGLLADSYPVSSEEAPGTVVAQRPGAGGTALEGSAVRLNVAIGTGTRPSRAVPDVTGLNERAARDRLRRTGFTVRAIERKVTARDENGVVILQSPDAGRSLRLGIQITIYVGRLR